MPLRHLCRATCVLCKLSVVTCAVVLLQIICVVQSGVFECCATDHFYRQKLLATETCVPVLVHCADKVLVPTVLLHTLWTQEAAQDSGRNQRHKKIDRHGNIACALCRWGGGGKKKKLIFCMSFNFSKNIFEIPFVCLPQNIERKSFVLN